jgi:hypothetical protein
LAGARTIFEICLGCLSNASGQVIAGGTCLTRELPKSYATPFVTIPETVIKGMRKRQPGVPYLTMAAVRAPVLVMEKTGAQLRAESITRDNIASLQARLDAEANEGKRRWLEILLTEQLALLSPD